MSDPGDPLALARALIRRPSVTPEDAGAISLLQDVLGPLGFTCHLLVFETPGTAPVVNLHARLGTGAPALGFAGHTDVVPPGERAAWSADPFAAEIRDGVLYGRGACDMKGAIAAFVAATARFLASHGPPPGSIALLVTGDEEGPGINGTRRLLDWMAKEGLSLDACIVGEPTNPERLGDCVKIGRRGSLNGHLVVHGRQGHVAYPDRADNPLHRLLRMLETLLALPLDRGTAHFQPSSLQLTSIDTGNKATNLIPARAEARFNIRYNDAHSRASLEAWLRGRLEGEGQGFLLTLDGSGDAFLTRPGPLVDLVVEAVFEVTGRRPAQDTSGGTSDARFVKDHCPVVELGLVGATMHQVDERVAVEDLERLTRVYQRILERFFEVA